MRAFGQMGVVAAGGFLQLFPCLDRNLAVGFGCEHQDHFPGIDRGFQFCLALRDAPSSSTTPLSSRR